MSEKVILASKERTEHLRPCPWCQAIPNEAGPDRYDGTYLVICQHPDCEVQPKVRHDSIVCARRIWNARNLPAETGVKP